MKWYLVSSKEDDYGACNRDLIKCGKGTLKHVYHHENVADEDVEVLKKYFTIINNMDFEDFGYKNLEEYLEEYYG